MGMIGQFQLGALTFLPVSGDAVPSVAKGMGIQGVKAIEALKERVRVCIMQDYNLTELYHASCQAERVQPFFRLDTSKYQASQFHVYWQPKVDKGDQLYYTTRHACSSIRKTRISKEEG